MIASATVLLVLSAAPLPREATACGPIPPVPEVPTAASFRCPADFEPNRQTAEEGTLVECRDPRGRVGDSLFAAGDQGAVIRRAGLNINWEQGQVTEYRMQQDDHPVGMDVRRTPGGALIWVMMFNDRGELACGRVYDNGELAKRFDGGPDAGVWTWLGSDGKPIEPARPLKKNEVARTIHESEASVRFCYESVLAATPKLAGKLTLSWSIQNGAVSNIQVQEDSLKSPEVLACVKGRVEKMKFRPANEVTEVSFPWVFVPAKREP